MAMARDSHGQLMPVPSFVNYPVNVAVSATSVSSAAVLEGTKAIRICSAVDIYYAIGQNPTATSTTGALLPANVIEFVAVQPGDKLSVIQAVSGSTGSCSIIEVA